MTKNRKGQTILFPIILFSLFTVQLPAAVYAQEDSLQAIEIELSKPVDGVISTAGESDWYKFNATADSSYVIEVYNQSLTMTAFFTLYSAEETIITWSYSKITYNFTETGTYLIEVKHSDSTYGVGTYSLLIRPAQPPSIVVNAYDNNFLFPIEDATARVYTPLSYDLIGENQTSINGESTIQLASRGYYLVTVSKEGYNDLFGVTTLLDEGPNIRWAGLSRVEYTGLVLSSALVKDVVTPGKSNTIALSFFNLNSTYPITVTNITVVLPWFGFFEGQVRGIMTITDGMPITIPPNTIWVASIPFTTPSDITAYVGLNSAASYVDFNARAPAWRTTFEVAENVGLIEHKDLVTAEVIPELQSSQGFRAPLVGVSMIPITDPPANEKLAEVSLSIQDIASEIQDLAITLDEMTFRVGETNAELATVSSRLNGITSILNDANLKLDEVSSKLSISDSKLSGISSRLVTTNDKLDAVTTELQTVNREISTLSSQQQETNTKLDTIDNQLTATREQTDTLFTELFGDLRTLLLAIIGVTGIIAAANILYLAKNFGLISK